MSAPIAFASIRKLDVVDERLAALKEERDIAAERYRLDPFAHADDGHVTILDLETKRPVVFEPYAHQREFGEAWITTTKEGVEFANLHEEKSRQMGMTWLLAYLVWWILNYHEAPGGVIHRKLGEVCDSGPTPDSFFGRVKYIHGGIPEEFQSPLRFIGGNDPVIRVDGRPLSYFVGEGATTDPTRGGTYAYFILEEAARTPWGELVHAAVSRACPQGRVYNSTPFGKANVYYRLRQQKPADMLFLRHHWSRHPVYARGLHVAAFAPEAREPGRHAPQPTQEAADAANSCSLCLGTIWGRTWSGRDPFTCHRYPGKPTSPWYDAAVVEMTDLQVAQELDIDYTASLSGRVYPEFSWERHVHDRIPYDQAFPLSFALDYGLDTTAVAIIQETPTEIRQIGELEVSDLTPEEVVAALRAELRALQVPENEIALLPEKFAVGDPAGEGRDLATVRPLTADYRAAGLSIVSERSSVYRTVLALKRLLLGRPKGYAISATCVKTIAHLEENRWPTDRAGNPKPGPQHPVDDEHNHMARALAYYTTFRFPPPIADDGYGEPEDGPHGSPLYPLDPDTGRVDPSITPDMRL